MLFAGVCFLMGGNKLCAIMLVVTAGYEHWGRCSQCLCVCVLLSVVGSAEGGAERTGRAQGGAS